MWTACSGQVAALMALLDQGAAIEAKDIDVSEAFWRFLRMLGGGPLALRNCMRVKRIE